MSPHIQKGNEGIVHHILVYDCFLDDDLQHESHDCNSENMPIDLIICQGATALSAWAIGGKVSILFL